MPSAAAVVASAVAASASGEATAAATVVVVAAGEDSRRTKRIEAPSLRIHETDHRSPPRCDFQMYHIWDLFGRAWENSRNCVSALVGEVALFSLFLLFPFRHFREAVRMSPPRENIKDGHPWVL